MDLGLSGRKAIVTAASRGIGLSIAQLLADEGVDVAICARAEGGLEAARKDLEGRGVKVFTKSVDVSDGVKAARSKCRPGSDPASKGWHFRSIRSPTDRADATTLAASMEDSARSTPTAWQPNRSTTARA